MLIDARVSGCPDPDPDHDHDPDPEPDPDPDPDPDPPSQRPTDMWEWQPAIGEQAPRVMVDLWRKSPQFFGLRRQHAHDVVTDADVWQAFVQHCKSYFKQGGCAALLCCRRAFSPAVSHLLPSRVVPHRP